MKKYINILGTFTNFVRKMEHITRLPEPYDGEVLISKYTFDPLINLSENIMDSQRTYFWRNR